MPVRWSRWLPLVLAAAAVLSPDAHAQKGPALPDVLLSGANYLVQYAEKVSAITAEEEYTQYDTSSGKMGVPRRLNADFLLLGSGNGVINGFRDVFAIDNAALRPREDRLLALFQAAAPGALDQARQLSEDSVRHYLSPNVNALGQPTAALEFLRKENQERSTFKLEGVKKMDGVEVAVVKFNEQGMPRMIPSPGDAPAVGRFWIDPSSGAVRQTELGLSSKAFNVRSTVKYALEPKTGLWLPAEMSQQFDISGPGSGGVSNMGSGGGYSAHQSLEARASYSKFRQVQIDLSKVK